VATAGKTAGTIEGTVGKTDATGDSEPATDALTGSNTTWG
jgi:hypothetical protein